MGSEAEEYLRLVNFYRSLSDSQLYELWKQSDDLTPVARGVLENEAAVRRLNYSTVGPSFAHDHVRPADQRKSPFAALAPDQPSFNMSRLGAFAQTSSPDCVWEFRESEDARAAAEYLRASGIESDLILPKIDTLDMGAPRLAVMSDDAERARQLLSMPIPEEFKTFVKTEDQFIVPSCPKCGSIDPLLESVEPTNRWRCEFCSNTWQEAAP